MNGDGILDLVEIATEPGTSCDLCEAEEHCYTWTVHPGGPEGFRADRSFPWTVPERTFIDGFGSCTSEGMYPGLSQFSAWGTTRRVVDLDGDAIPDLVSSDGSKPFWEVRFGRFEDSQAGGGFPLNPANPVTFEEVGGSLVVSGGTWHWPSPGGIIRESQFAPPGEYLPAWGDAGWWVRNDLVDMNGDGLLDYVEGAGPHGQGTPAPLQVWYNTGAGFAADPQPFPVAYSMIALTTEEDSSSPHAQSKQVLGLYDMNGDGLPDQVKGAAAHPTYWEVWINDGTEMVGPYQWPIHSGSGLWYLNRAVPLSGGGFETLRDLLDINGDGLPDLVEANPAVSTWQVWLNRGNGFAADASVLTNAGFPIRLNGSGTRIRDTIDVDGDGMADHFGFVGGDLRVYRNGGGAWCATADDPNDPGAQCTTVDGAVDVLPRLAGHRPHLLRVVRNGVGGETLVDFRPSNQWPVLDPPEMPFVTWTVSACARMRACRRPASGHLGRIRSPNTSSMPTDASTPILASSGASGVSRSTTRKAISP